MQTVLDQLASELALDATRLSAAIALMDAGATVPFIARYRKEQTGGLDDTQLRQMEERLRYLRELDERRQTVLSTIDEQGKLTPDLAQAIRATTSKTELEDLYRPFRPRRRTKGQIAIEAGLEPLADTLLAQPEQVPLELAGAYLNPEQQVSSPEDALTGARYILMERFAEQADLLRDFRERLMREGVVQSRAAPGQVATESKFADYFEYQEAWSRIPSHRALALFRGRKDGVLQLSLVPDPGQYEEGQAESLLADFLGLPLTAAGSGTWFAEVARWTWRVKVLPHLETELFGRLRERAESAAIDVFGRNLNDLLLAPPAGPRVTMGLDPAYRTGVKVVVVDATGKLLEHDTVYPHAPQKRWQDASQRLQYLIRTHRVSLLAVGNGTASRETDQLARELVRAHSDWPLEHMMVSEAGASVYSASELAAREFPDLDVSIRGAVSIARRLQDPLAELVKIDPKAIGVGQYQHDVSQVALARALDAVVEDCVNGVGVDLNTASASLLSRVSGLSRTLAENLVAWRNENGRFTHRGQLLEVPRLGAKTFEQCAGFLRIRNGSNPLDASAVHPEAYPVVERLEQLTGEPVSALIGQADRLGGVRPEDLVNARFGLPTVRDILAEMAKPGRDPRPEFRTVRFSEAVQTLQDLRENMILEGVVTNVTNFGAFVDVGVHQDGLVHISALSHEFVRDPGTVVRAGDQVRVKVISLDLPRRRIGLSMRLDDSAGATRDTAERSPASSAHHKADSKRNRKGSSPAAGQNAMADKLQAALAKSRR